MWLLELAVIRSGLIDINPLHSNTLTIVAAGAAAFSVGGLFAGFAPRQFLRIHLFSIKPKKSPDFFRNMLIVVLLCGLPLVFYQILQLSNLAGGGSNILVQARVAVVVLDQNQEPSLSILILGYFASLATYTSLLFATEKTDRKFWIVTVIALCACILSTGRTDLLLLVSGLCAIRLLQRRQECLRDAIRLLRWPIALFIVFFIGLSFTNKSNEGMTGGVIGIASNAVLSYIAGPLAAFDCVVQNPANFAMSMSHTFQLPLRLAAMLHLATYTQPPAFDSYVFVPFPTNVYTVFKFYFLELGSVGTIALMLLIGLLHSLLYLKARLGGRLSTYLFAYSMFPVLMVIFDDHYYITGLNLRAIAFGLLYFIAGSVHLPLFPAMERNLSPQTEA
jgi:oligosaccharide repeat unit polymerase